jgi:hypothetical protein
MPQNQQHVTAAASGTKFTLLSHDASRIFVRHNSRDTLLTSKQINGLQRSLSQTQESPDASSHHQQRVTAAESDREFTAPNGASQIFVRHNLRITLLTSKQINGLQRNASETQESPDAPFRTPPPVCATRAPPASIPVWAIPLGPQLPPQPSQSGRLLRGTLRSSASLIGSPPSAFLPCSSVDLKS